MNTKLPSNSFHTIKTLFNIYLLILSWISIGLSFNKLFGKSPTSDMTWPDNVFISGGNPHLTSQFCGVVLGPTTISKMVSEPLQDPLGHLLSGFCYRATHHLCSRTKPNNASREMIAPTYKHIVRPCPVQCGTLNIIII